MEHNTGDPIYDLLMPFVACASNGGPYDDEAFVAGFRLGHLDLRMHSHKAVESVAVHPAEVPQVDLMAMRHGYEVEVEDHSEEWTMCSFTYVGHKQTWPNE